jgi:hypothetical protein
MAHEDVAHNLLLSVKSTSGCGDETPQEVRVIGRL